MGRPHLEGFSVRHQPLDGISHLGSGEFFPLGLLAGEDRDGQLGFGELLVKGEDAQRFGLGILITLMDGMPLLPEELGRPEERPGHFLPADDIGPLVDEERQVPVGFDPFGVGRADDGLGRGPDGEPFFEDLAPPLGHPSHFGGKPLDMIGLLLEVALGDEQGEIGVDVPAGLEPAVQQALDVLPHGVAVGPDDHHPFHGRVIGQLSFADEFEIPLGKIFALRGELLDQPFVVHVISFDSKALVV
jgi:hypothetical protein